VDGPFYALVAIHFVRPLPAGRAGEAIRLLAAASQKGKKAFLIPVGKTPAIFARDGPPGSFFSRDRPRSNRVRIITFA